MARILVIEDDRSIQKVVSYNLERAEHEVISAHQGREGLEMARHRSPDLVVLDLMLPDLPGVQICTLLKQDRATQRIPIIILTARGDEIDRVQGLELGAADYVVKPFSVRELMLRIAALLRRCQLTDDAPQMVIEIGELRIDRDAHEVAVNGTPVALTAIEYKLLCTLYDRRNRVSSRGALLDEIWGQESEVTARVVDTHIQRLRDKLGSVASYVETVRGFGYRFIAPPGASPGASPG
ncbi:MAG: response regulator transcription factor [Deltaproteobacteria bacterium]|nr:response regulator transcription factor [Deltaproteobacteria bacterium]MDQ3299709.1 response regulator transcription factor [Myxococcota bacterium]